MSHRSGGDRQARLPARSEGERHCGSSDPGRYRSAYHEERRASSQKRDELALSMSAEEFSESSAEEMERVEARSCCSKVRSKDAAEE